MTAPSCVVCGELIEPGDECRQTSDGLRHCPGKCSHSNVLMVAGLNAIERKLTEIERAQVDLRRDVTRILERLEPDA